jgi:ribonuclease D
LKHKGRLAWHEESCARLIVDCSQPVVVDEDAVWRIKGSTFLTRGGLAVLRELWRWREREATAANRPPFFVLSHELMIKIAGAAAEHQPFDAMIPPRMHPKRKENLLTAVHTALALPPEKYPRIVRHHSPRPTEAEFQRFRAIEKVRDANAHELEIDPTIIASKATLGDLARDWEKHSGDLMKWQRGLLEANAG